MAGGGDVTVRVLGANRLARTLKKAGADVADMKDASERVGAIVAREAKVRAPKRSGTLAGSIRPSRRQRGVQIRTGSFRYAWVQEYGSAKRNIRPKRYMMGALESKRDEAVAAYFSEMEKIMGK